MRSLVITKNVPWPANSGEKLRTLGVVRTLAALGPVTVVGYAGPHDEPRSAVEDGVSVTWVQLRKPSPAAWLLAAIRERSITAGRWCGAGLRAAVDHELRRGADLVVVEHVQLAGLLPAHRAGATNVLDMHNVESVLTARLSETTASRMKPLYRIEAAALRRLERRSVPRFGLTCVVSEADRAALAEVVTAVTAVVPNAIATDRPPLPPALTPTVCFVGLLGWAPNAEAAAWFVREVWPLVREAVADAQLLLVGRDPTSGVQALAAPDVEVSGTVDSVDPWYARSQIAVAPLLAGGGSRLKIMEALVKGRPVVATRVGAEGLEDLIGRGVLVADRPEEMAAEVIALLRDPSRAAALGRAGADAVRADHSWQAATRPLLDHALAAAG